MYRSLAVAARLTCARIFPSRDRKEAVLASLLPHAFQFPRQTETCSGVESLITSRILSHPPALPSFTGPIFVVLMAHAASF